MSSRKPSSRCSSWSGSRTTACTTACGAGVETCVAGAFGNHAVGLPRAEGLGQREGDEMFDRHVLTAGQFGDLLEQFVRHFGVDDAHNQLRSSARNSPGVSTLIPNLSAPAKSRLLKVTRWGASQFLAGLKAV